MHLLISGGLESRNENQVLSVIQQFLDVMVGQYLKFFGSNFSHKEG